MLDFRNDRLDYGRLLIPPEGYRLDRAVAATYSLDLNTLLSIPVALFYSQTLEGKIQGERFQLLEAIQRTSETVTVYCQHGQIHVPERYNRLFAFMEQMIVPVTMADAFSSFHPKTWVLRYQPEDAAQAVIYRVLVLSRNLTYDRSWDVAVALEGKVASAQRRDNRPLVDFIGHLHGLRPFAGYTKFSRDLARVKFEAPGDFSRVRFHPIGIPGYTDSPVLDAPADEALCLSPFVDDDTLNALRDLVQGKFWLFGRRLELEKLSAATLRNCEAYCLTDRVVEGEREADDGAKLDCLPQDLHAKLFVFQQSKETRWLLGSANATKAARERNVEFLVELTGSEKAISLAAVQGDLLDAARGLNVFEEFSADQAGKHDLQAGRANLIRRLEFALSKAGLTGHLAPAANQTNYDLTINLDLRGVTCPEGLIVTMTPMSTREGIHREPIALEFGALNQPVYANLAETDLSRFLAFTISDGEESLRHFLLRFEIEGLPASRLDRIVKDIVSNTDQFFDYLRFLLTDDLAKGDFEVARNGNGKRGGHADEHYLSTELPLFESMVVAASRDPQKLRAVDSVVQRLKSASPEGTPLIPVPFLDFWEVFRPLIPAGKGKEAEDAN